MQEIHANAAMASAPLPKYHALFPWVELIAGFFGFHGVGYLLARKPTRGISWLVFSIVKHAIGAGLIVVTAGFALACLLPLDILLSFYLAIHVARAMRHEQHATLAPATV
jgi:hypothetical protein